MKRKLMFLAGVTAVALALGCSQQEKAVEKKVELIDKELVKNAEQAKKAFNAELQDAEKKALEMAGGQEKRLKEMEKE